MRFVPFLILSLSLSPMAWAASPGSVSNEEIQLRMKSSVHAAKSRMGVLEEWQEEVYSQEIVPHYARFIQENLDVDLDGIRKYLTFSGGRLFSGSTPKVLLFVKGESRCGRCRSATGDIKELVEEIASRRGFDPVWVSEEEVGDSALFWEELDERIHELARLRGAAAVWVVQARNTPLDNIDTAHARDKKFQLRSFMLVRSEREMRRVVQKNVGLYDGFQQAASEAILDTFLFFGGEVLAALAPADEDKDEISLVVPGSGDYSRFLKIKALLETGLQAIGDVHERKLSRNQLVFTVRTNSAPEVVRRILRSLSTPDTPLQISNLDGRTIWVEFPVTTSPSSSADADSAFTSQEVAKEGQ